MSDAALSVRDVSVSFGGVAALQHVTADFPSGEIIGIIGPNGAGKTTLLNVICGMNPPDSGEVFLGPARLNGLKPNQIAVLGLRRTFQSSQLFAGMSVLENMMTGLHLMGSTGLFGAVFRSRRMRDEEAQMRERSLEALDFVGFRHFADRPGSALSFGQQRIIEIARTLIFEPKVVLLDEPAVGLSVNRVAELDELLRRIRDERGVTLVMIEHVIRLVMGVSDRVMVLNSGRKIAEGLPDDVRNDETVVEAYLGTRPMLEVRNLNVWYGVTEVLRDVSFQVPEGRIVALLGGNGSGKTTVLNTLSGLLQPRAGQILFAGGDVAGQSSDRMVKAGIVQVPQGREVFATMTVNENLELGAATRHDRDGIRDDLERIYELFPHLVERRTRRAGSLSGGEQQQVAIGRALMARPRLLLMDEPSVGLSPIIVDSVIETVKKLHARGLTILIVEQNVGVAAAVAEDAFVLKDGAIAFQGDAPSLINNPEVLSSYLGR